MLYADDTICVSEDTKTMNLLLAAIEQEGLKYGLKLNKTKCETLIMNGTANVHFPDGTPVKQLPEVKYLGCYLNENADLTKEVKSKIADCMATLKKLDKFWLHSSCPDSFKISVQDAVIRSKLLYGLEPAELKQPELNKLDGLQLKGLRKILRLDTTFINRANSNKQVFEIANNQIKEDGYRNKQIRKFSEAYITSKLKCWQEVVSADDNNPIEEATYNPNTFEMWSYGIKRKGRPREGWFKATRLQYWEKVKG